MRYAAPLQYSFKDNATFPNSDLPVLWYRQALSLPVLFPAASIRDLFARNNWTNNRDQDIYGYPHYHAGTHEVIGVYRGKAWVEIGGAEGQLLELERGDVLVIPAGVVHRKCDQRTLHCIVGYPEGRSYDIHYGIPGERPATDRMINALPVPLTDPLWGSAAGLPLIWSASRRSVLSASLNLEL